MIIPLQLREIHVKQSGIDCEGISTSACIDYKEVFSPLLSKSSFRLLINIANIFPKPIHTVNITTALCIPNYKKAVFVGILRGQHMILNKINCQK
jgi:hypothetical protein